MRFAESSADFCTLEVAEIYFGKGLYAAAEKIYQKIVETDPHNLEAEKRLREIEEKKKIR